MSIGSVGGGNYFSDLNAKLAARGPDQAAQESAKAAGGGKATEAKSNKADKSEHHHHVHHDGLNLSKAALDQQMADSGQATEMADMLGLNQEANTQEDGQIHERSVRNNDRHTRLGEDDEPRVVASQNAEAHSDDKQAERLQIIDNEDHPMNLNADVPDANLEAASRVLSGQTTGGVAKVAKLHAVPEVLESGPIEKSIVGFSGEPMDIRDVSNDPRCAPMQIEIPEETHAVAREMAARQLASGELDEAMIR